MSTATKKLILKGIGAAALGVTVALALQPAAVAAVADQQARPGTGTYQQCRGITVDKHAPVISTASAFVKASPKTLWRLHTDIDHWSAWIPEITPAHKTTPGPLRPGSVFEWSPQNMHVTSTVKAVTSQRCTAWAAPVNGIDGVHLFTFRPVRGGVIATTEESWSGPPVEADIPGNQAALDTGLQDWITRLKQTAEAQTHCP